MKKVLLALVLIVMTAIMFTSCAGNRRGYGCPTTNPRYFRA